MIDLRSMYSVVKNEIPNGVELVAVSKTQPIEAMLSVYHLGQKMFGENYVQELIEKAKKISDLGIKDIEFHFIGHLQSNKVKLLLPHISCIQSVDSFKLLKEINHQANSLGVKMPCYFQVNIDEEQSKGGFLATDLEALSVQIKEYSNIIPEGLMIIPDPNRNPARAFQQTRELSKQYSHALGGKLSMGMSHDYLQAIQNGATLVRVGSKIFGERKTKT